MNLEAICPAVQKCKQDLSWDVNNFKNRLANQKYGFWTAVGEMTGIGTLRGIGKDWAQIRCLNRTVQLIERSAGEIRKEYESLPEYPNFNAISEIYMNTQSLLNHSYKTFQEASDTSKGALISKLFYLGSLGIMGMGASLGSTLVTASGLGLSVLMGSAFLFRANYQDGDFWAQSQVKNLELHLNHLNKQWDHIQCQESAVPLAAEPSANTKSASAA